MVNRSPLRILAILVATGCSAASEDASTETTDAGDSAESTTADASTASSNAMTDASSDPSTSTTHAETGTDDTTTTDVPGGSSGDADTSTSESTGMPPDDGSTSDDESTTSDDETTTDDDSSTGEPIDNDVDGFYGDCANAPAARACNLGAGEICINGPGGAAFCTVANCDDVEDCGPTTSGDAPVVCAPLSDGVSYCYISCSEDQTCPDGMECVAEICAWTLAAPGGGVCPDVESAGELPQMLAGTNAGLFDDVLPACAPGGEDALVAFTAPQAGTYRFTTAGSDFDTILEILDGCGGSELACNDDAEGLDLQSAVEVELAAEQSIVIVVDGYAGALGDYTLDISLLP